MNSKKFHIPVLTKQLFDAIDINSDGTYVDLTGGCGGHSELIFKKLSNSGQLIIFDRDYNACKYLLDHFNGLKANNPGYGKVQIVCECFSSLAGYISKRSDINQVNGIIGDLGISSAQLDDPSRGFSFRFDHSPLDMRMTVDDDHQTAADFINNAPMQKLSWVFYHYGQEPKARQIAYAIEKARKHKPITTTSQLSELVTATIKYKTMSRRHLATRVFQALRIFINKELEELSTHLQQGLELIAPQGFWALISFHSLEDRLIKQRFKFLAKKSSRYQ